MELALILLLALLLVVAWGAMPKPDARRVPSEEHGRANEDGPTITVTDYSDDRSRPLRWVLPILAGLATLAAAVTAIVVGADL